MNKHQHGERRPWQDRIRRRWTQGALILLGIGGAITVGWMSGCGLSDTDMTVEANDHADERSDIVTLDPAAIQNIDLQVEPVVRRMVTQTLRATGTVSPNATRVAHLRPLARGRIERVYVRLGDRVRAGQPLLTYDNIELGELIGAFAQAYAAASVAQRALERARQLVDIGAISQAEYDRRSAEYAGETATIRNIKVKLLRFGMRESDLDSLTQGGDGLLDHLFSYTVLRAPFGGVITAYDVAEGEVVDADRELLTVVDLSTVWVQADVYEKDIALVREGQTVTVTVEAYPDQSFTGTITYVSDMLDPQTRTAKVRCEVPNSGGRLKLEMFATIQIPILRNREAIMLPTSAIQQIDDKPVVFVQTGEGRFERRDVRLDVESNGWTEIIQGVQEGESVVTTGSFYLKSIMLREQIGEGE